MSLSSNKLQGDRASSGKGKFQPVNINNQFAGKSLVAQKSGQARYGLTGLGKQPAVVRRLPPPANLPSLKAESSGQDPSVNLVPSGGPGWGSQEPQPPSNESALNAQQKTPQNAYQKGVQSISSTAGGHGVTAQFAQGAGGTARGALDAQKPPGWENRGEGDSGPFFAQSARDFPSLEASGDAKGTGESGAPSLRPQKFGSWKSGGGGVGSKGFNEESPTAQSPTNGAPPDELSPAPSPGTPSMDHPPHHHYTPPSGQSPYPNRMYPGGPQGPYPPGPPHPHAGMGPRGYLPPHPQAYGAMGHPGYPAMVPGGYPPPRGPPMNGAGAPYPRGYHGGPMRGPMPGPQQHPASTYDGGRGHGPSGQGGGPQYGPPHPGQGREYPPAGSMRDIYPPHAIEGGRDEFAGGQSRGGRPPSVGNGMERRIYAERGSDRAEEYQADYNENERVVWSDDEATGEGGARKYDYRATNRDADAWSDPEHEHYDNGARAPPRGQPPLPFGPQSRGPPRDYVEYDVRGPPRGPPRQPMPPSQRGRQQMVGGYPPQRGHGDYWGDYYQGPHYPPGQGMAGPPYGTEARRYPTQMPPRGPPVPPHPYRDRDIRDIDDEEDEERRRQLQQNAEREAAIERSRQQRRLAPQSSLTSSTGTAEVADHMISGRGRPDSTDYDQESDLERPSSRDEHAKPGRKGHAPVPPRFQRHTDGGPPAVGQGQSSARVGRGHEDRVPSRPKSHEAFEDQYAQPDYYGRNGDYDGGYRGSDRGQRPHQSEKYGGYSSNYNKRRDDQRERREVDYRKSSKPESSGKDRSVSEENENLMAGGLADSSAVNLLRHEDKQLRRHESKDSLSSGCGRSSEKSYDRKEKEGPKEDKAGKDKGRGNNYTIEAPSHPATVREEGSIRQDRFDDDEDEIAPMQVLSKPAAKVVKRTAGGSHGSSSSGRQKHSDRSSKPAQTSEKTQRTAPKDATAVVSSRQSSGSAAVSAGNQPTGRSKQEPKVEEAPPAKNVWEQRKEERESQEREKRSVWQPTGSGDEEPSLHQEPTDFENVVDFGNPPTDEVQGSGHLAGHKRPAEDSFRGSRGSSVGKGGPSQRGPRTREFISQSRRNRGGSALGFGPPRAPRGRGMSYGSGSSRRGGSVPSGPIRREDFGTFIATAAVEPTQQRQQENEENEKQEEEGAKKEEPPKEEKAVGESNPWLVPEKAEEELGEDNKDQKASNSIRGMSSDRGARGRTSMAQNSRRGDRNSGGSNYQGQGGMYGDPRMMRSFYFPWATGPNPFTAGSGGGGHHPRGVRGSRGRGGSTSVGSYGGRGGRFSSSGRGRGGLGGRRGGREPPDRGRPGENEEEEDEENREGSLRGARGTLPPRHRPSRGRGGRRGSPSGSAAQAKSPNQSEGQDEWETASESSDVGRKREGGAKKSGGPQRFSAQRRERGARQTGGGPQSGNQSRQLGGAGTVTWGPGSGPNRGHYKGSGRGSSQNFMESTESKNVNPASRQGNQAANRKMGTKFEGSRSGTFKPDALAGVDFNNVAGVVIIDNQPDVVFDPHLDGFQEVVSKKEKRLRREMRQANDIPETKAASPGRRERKGAHTKPTRSGLNRDRDSSRVDSGDMASHSKSGRKNDTSSFVTFNTDAISGEIGTWSNAVQTDSEAAIFAVSRAARPISDEDSSVGHVTTEFGMATAVSNGFEAVVFEAIGRTSEGGLSSKTGVEIWGNPDPMQFADKEISKDMERPAPAKSVEFPADMTLGSGGDIDDSDKFDFTFDPNLPTVTNEGDGPDAGLTENEAPLVSPAADLSREGVKLEEKLNKVRNVWAQQAPEESTIQDSEDTAVVSAANMVAQQVSAALLYKQNQVENQQNMNVTVVGKSSLAEGPNVAKVKPQQQQQSPNEFLPAIESVTGAVAGPPTGNNGIKLNLTLVDIETSNQINNSMGAIGGGSRQGICRLPIQAQPSEAPSSSSMDQSINSPPILTPPTAASFFNSLAQGIRAPQISTAFGALSALGGQPRVQQQMQMDFSQPPPNLQNFQASQAQPQVGSLWTQQLGATAAPPHIFRQQQQDVFGRPTGGPQQSATNPMFISTSSLHQPQQPIASPPNFIAQLAQGNLAQGGKPMPPSHGGMTPSQGTFGVQSPGGSTAAAFILQQDHGARSLSNLMNMSQPPPMFGAIGSQRGGSHGVASSGPQQQVSTSGGFVITANPFSPGSGTGSLLGPPPNQGMGPGNVQKMVGSAPPTSGLGPYSGFMGKPGPAGVAQAVGVQQLGVQQGFNPAQAPPVGGPGFQFAKSPGSAGIQGFATGLTPGGWVPRHSPGAQQAQFSQAAAMQIQKLVPGPGPGQGFSRLPFGGNQGFGLSLIPPPPHHGNRNPRHGAGTPSSTTSGQSGSGVDVKTRDGDLLEQIDQFVLSTEGDEEMSTGGKSAEVP